MVPAAEYLGLGASRSRRARTRRSATAARARPSSRACTRPTTALLDETGAMDFGEMIVRAIRLLEERPAARQRVVRALPRGAGGRVPGHQLRPAAAAAPAGRRPRQRGRGGRRRPVDLPVPGRLAQEHRRLPADVPRREGASASRPTTARTRRSSTPPMRWSSPTSTGCRRSCARRAAARALGLDPVSFWRCENERAQAQAVAAEIERLVADGIDPAETAVLVRSVRNEGQLMATALEERGIPYRLVGGAGFFERSEVRDLLAWLRLLADPQDSRAVVRALMRPPVELGPVDLARCTTIARRRKTDMITGLRAALESPDVPPEGRDAHRELPEAAPQRVPRLRRDAPGPVRAPPDRAHRPAQAAPVQHQLRVARAAGEHREVRRPGRRLGAAAARPHVARLRRVRDAPCRPRGCARRTRSCTGTRTP